jgi:hypothetical protein
MRAEGYLPQAYRDVPNLFYQAFAPGTTDFRRRLYVEQVQLAVQNLNNFIIDHNVSVFPIESVFDRKIHN